MSDSLRPHESQHAKPPCPSPTPGVHLDSRSSSQWCHPAISSSVIPFSSCPQSLPASKSFPMSQVFAWGGQSTGALALALLLPKKSQKKKKKEIPGLLSFRMDWLDLLAVQGTLRSLLHTTVTNLMCFIFLVYVMGIILVPAHESTVRVKWTNIFKDLWIVPGKYRASMSAG